MTLMDIRKQVSQMVAQMIGEGYVLVDDDSSFGHICRYDLAKAGAKTKYRIWLQNEYESGGRYLAKVAFYKAVMPVEDTFVRKDAIIETIGIFYELGTTRKAYTPSLEEALAAHDKSVDRYATRHLHETRLHLRVTSKLCLLLRKYKGFGKCNVHNTTAYRTGNSYVVETMFAGRKHQKVFSI